VLDLDIQRSKIPAVGGFEQIGGIPRPPLLELVLVHLLIEDNRRHACWLRLAEHVA